MYILVIQHNNLYCSKKTYIQMYICWDILLKTDEQMCYQSKYFLFTGFNYGLYFALASYKNWIERSFMILCRCFCADNNNNHNLLWENRADEVE